VIASAVLPTLVANTFFLPRHLLPHKKEGVDGSQGLPKPLEAGEQA
jgi:hypothetical protein